MNDETPSSQTGMPPSPPVCPGFRSGVVALVGRANVGKSSLLNALLGEKVSIVSSVPQTTRHRIRGIQHEARGQIVWLDTPGVHRAPSDLGRMMNKSARHAAEGAEEVLLVLDGSEPPEQEDEGWMRRLAAERGAEGWMIAVNKADAGDAYVPKLRELWRQAAAGRGVDPEQVPWHFVSAATGAGISGLVDCYFRRLPEHPPLFPEDTLTDFPRKLFIADVIREKLFLRLTDELPHRVAVWVEELDERPDGAWAVACKIFVERPSQLGILVGIKGRALRAVKRASEAELAKIYDHPVLLRLHVAVEPHWTRNFFFLKRLGIDL